MDRGRKMVYLAKKKNELKTLNLSALGTMKPDQYIRRWFKKYYDDRIHGVDLDDKENVVHDDKENIAEFTNSNDNDAYLIQNVNDNEYREPEVLKVISDIIDGILALDKDGIDNGRDKISMVNEEIKVMINEMIDRVSALDKDCNDNGGDGVIRDKITMFEEENSVLEGYSREAYDEDVDFVKNGDDKGKMVSMYDVVPDDKADKANFAGDGYFIPNVDDNENRVNEELEGINDMIDGILDSYPIQKEIIDKMPVPGNVDKDVNKSNKKKRKIQRLSLEERINRDRNAHKVIPASCKCEDGCGNDIREVDREDINSRFWQLSYNDRKIFLSQVARKGCVKRRRLDTPKEKRRSGNFEFSFKIDGIDVSVCQKFFLETLGYTSNQVLKTISKTIGEVGTICDSRGKSAAPNRLSQEVIDDIVAHIKSYDPQISHYRRVHAPNRLYLPSTLTITKMHKAYIENDGHNISYDIYRREVNRLNISFTKLGEEQCEVCVSHTHHTCSNPTLCDECVSLEKHLETANIARKKYKEDSENNHKNDKFSADLQKVVMLPRMPGIKTVVFTKRITAFNETFAPLGSKDQNPSKVSPYAVTWHNCNAQCKNWYIYSCLVIFINSNASDLIEITLKYFEKGHTFMSADSYHHMVELAMNEMGNVYDFEDWLDSLGRSGQALILEGSDCLLIKKGLSQGKHTSIPYIEDIQQVKFMMGSSKLFWKENMEDNEYSCGEFLQLRLTKMIEKEVIWPSYPQKYEKNASGCRGIPQSKIKGIQDKLCPLMPKEKRSFWQNVVSCEDNSDNE